MLLKPTSMIPIDRLYTHDTKLAYRKINIDLNWNIYFSWMYIPLTRCVTAKLANYKDIDILNDFFLNPLCSIQQFPLTPPYIHAPDKSLQCCHSYQVTN